jgi:hypothetical protein
LSEIFDTVKEIGDIFLAHEPTRFLLSWPPYRHCFPMIPTMPVGIGKDGMAYVLHQSRRISIVRKQQNTIAGQTRKTIHQGLCSFG